MLKWTFSLQHFRVSKSNWRIDFRPVLYIWFLVLFFFFALKLEHSAIKKNEYIGPTKHNHFETWVREVPGRNIVYFLQICDYTNYKRRAKIIIPKSTKYSMILQEKILSFIWKVIHAIYKNKNIFILFV